MVAGDEGGYGVRPRGCGSRLCPRCQRRRGAKIARRCIGWLAAEAHGWLYSFTLTQRVEAGEELVVCRRRMERKITRFTRALREAGFLAGMLTVHVCWSEAAGGWHYHVHGIAELPRGLGAQWFVDQWVGIGQAAGEGVLSVVARELSAAGPAMADLASDDGDLDFWREASSEAARAIQYPVRDMLQGVAAWRLGGESRIRYCLTEITRHAKAWKVHRSLGRWRRSAPVPEAPEAAAADEEKAGPVGQVAALGTVQSFVRRARAGDASVIGVFTGLELACRNDSDFGRRFVRFCRICAAWAARKEKG